MAAYIAAQPSVGELRFIARSNRSLLPNGVSGTDVIVSMVIPDLTTYEGSAGEPFFRDINRDRGGSYHSLYWYMNSGHAQTETKRISLMGPYAMVFSRSRYPSGSLDVSLFSQLGISGYVGTSGRGTVIGTATGVSSSYQRVVHWFNDVAQYWAYANSAGAFTSPPMKAGTYTMVLYRDEFEVARKSVSIGAGATVSSSIASTAASTTPALRIGEFNGRPTGFRNDDLQEHMHPSDTRMASWGPLTYTVGSSSLSGFPVAQIKEVNNPTTIKFAPTSSQTGAATLRTGTTLSFAGGRPQVTVNGWSGPAPSAPVDIYDAVELITTGTSTSPTTTAAQPTTTSR
ncbi:hypothetical protein FRC07_004097 [Ceratobasidium sp. 392]|nr:hypothetical protein FRC07_004097 [Ceratobasidium sp. 392]